MPKTKKTKPGRVDMQNLMKLVNKKAGRNVAHNLTGDNPTSVKEWIPTGSRWLDSIICKGQIAGIPVGKVTEIAGLESTGKSYMAAQIAANAQKMGKMIVYFVRPCGRWLQSACAPLLPTINSKGGKCQLPFKNIPRRVSQKHMLHIWICGDVFFLRKGWSSATIWRHKRLSPAN